MDLRRYQDPIPLSIPDRFAPTVLDDINHRMYDRHVPLGSPLVPQVEFRSTPTRCSAVFPMVDLRQPPRVSLTTATGDHPVSVNAKGPAHGYMNRVNDESDLRNQFYALQRGAPQGVFVPSSTSDLYRVTMPPNSAPVDQPHPHLFDRETQFRTRGSDVLRDMQVGKQVFNNCTQMQIKGGV